MFIAPLDERPRKERGRRGQPERRKKANQDPGEEVGYCGGGCVQFYGCCLLT